MTTTFFYVWPLWCACSFSGCEWAYCHGTLLCEFSIPKCGGVLGGNDQNRAEKQNVVLTWFRPVTWSSGHLGRPKPHPSKPQLLQHATSAKTEVVDAIFRKLRCRSCTATFAFLHCERRSYQNSCDCNKSWKTAPQHSEKPRCKKWRLSLRTSSSHI